VKADQTSGRTEVSLLCEADPSCKTCDEGVDYHDNDTDKGPEREVEFSRGISLRPSLRIPNSSPSHARFNPDESNLRVMRIGSLEALPSRIGIGPSPFQQLY
jgi:hypothetical protein